MRRIGWPHAAALFFATLLSTLYVGAELDGHPVQSLADLRFGASFALPLLAILVSHELGHYIASKLHRIDTTPPLFIPMPISLLGTMGAVIAMRGKIRSRAALLDVGASGPLAGLAVALPVLAYGLYTSPVQPLAANGEHYMIEGRSLLYVAMLTLIKGPIPQGQDIFLTPTAFAAWAGLLVTMINLLPVGQLDGGHVAYALFGEAQNRYSRLMRRLLPLLAIGVSAAHAVPAWLHGVRGDALINEASAGVHWMIWSVVLWLMLRRARVDHPETTQEPLDPRRRAVAIVTLGFFVLLFMPVWIRSV